MVINLPKYMTFIYSPKFNPELINCEKCNRNESIELSSVRKMARRCITIFKQTHLFNDVEMFDNIFKTTGWYILSLDSKKNIVKSWFGNTNTYNYQDLAALITFHTLNNVSFENINEAEKLQWLSDNEIDKAISINKTRISKLEINNNINKYFDLLVSYYVNREIWEILREWKKKNWYKKLSIK